MSWHQLVAGYLAGLGTKALYGVRYTDMCAYRAIRRDCLEALQLREMTYGWNIEMQMRAAQRRAAHSRSADALSPAQRRQIQGGRHIAWIGAGGVPDRADFCARRRDGEPRRQSPFARTLDHPIDPPSFRLSSTSRK